MSRLWKLLCFIEVHHVPQEKRKPLHGARNIRSGRPLWFGTCTRPDCGRETFGQMR